MNTTPIAMEPRHASTERVESVQALRGLAALLVVFVHAVNLVDFRPDIAAGPAFDWQGFNQFGAIGVDIFFVISGFAMSAAISACPDRTAGGFLAERFVRIMPLFWLTALATVALLIPVGLRYSPAQIADTVTMFPLWDPVHYTQPVLPVGWTLVFEWAFYAVIALAIAVAPGIRRVRLALLLTLLLGFLGAVTPDRPDFAEFWISAMFLEFAAGIGLYLAFAGGLFRRHPWLAPALLAAGLAGFVRAIASNIGFLADPTVLFTGGDGTRILWWGWPAMAFAWGCVGLGERWFAQGGGSGRGWRLALLLGDSSYSLYLVHLPVILWLERELPGFPWRGEWLIVLLMVLSAGLGVAVHVGIEKPLLRAGRRWLHLRSPVSVASAV